MVWSRHKHGKGVVVRRYNKWAGNPKGNPENLERCIVDVTDGGRSMLSHQCYRKKGFGPNKDYCKQHAKMVAAGSNLYVPRDE